MLFCYILIPNVLERTNQSHSIIGNDILKMMIRGSQSVSGGNFENTFLTKALKRLSLTLGEALSL